MKRIRIYPYKMGSKSAKALKQELINRGHNVLLIKPDGRYRPQRNDLIIDWGMSTTPEWLSRNHGGWLNTTIGIEIAGNKLWSFQRFPRGEVSIPEFTTDGEYAHDQFMSGDWPVVLGRSKLTGHSGEGINILDEEQLFNQNDYPLYVKYIKKSAEYRVHVFDGEVIDVQQKMKRRDISSEEIDYKVRSHQNGWVFCREGITYDDQVIEESKKAVATLGLDFGAVDVIWNNYYQKAYVLEVNTAPGLEGSTLIKYADAIDRSIQEGN